MKNQKTVVEKVEEATASPEVLKFPLAIHKTLLEKIFAQQQLQKELSITVETFFATLQLDPSKYQVDVMQNVIVERTEPTPPEEQEEEPITDK